MKQTKEQVYHEFIKDIESITKSIESNTAYLGQYIKLQEFYKIVGIDDDELKNLLDISGFESLTDYYNRKNSFITNDSTKIDYFIATLKGINKSIKKKLLSDLQQSE